LALTAEKLGRLKDCPRSCLDGGTQPMDRKIIADRLAQSERHVAQDDGHIKKQRELIAKLEENRLDTARAEELLDTLSSLQEAHIAERDRLRGELKKEETRLRSTTD
jgi:hypothetical protein